MCNNLLSCNWKMYATNDGKFHFVITVSSVLFALCFTADFYRISIWQEELLMLNGTRNNEQALK